MVDIIFHIALVFKNCLIPKIALFSPLEELSYDEGLSCYIIFVVNFSPSVVVNYLSVLSATGEDDFVLKGTNPLWESTWLGEPSL
jgi:hypothetical protein